MKNDAIKLFNVMYSFLDDIYQKDNSEELLVYISDANPTICLDGKSLDPVVFEDFETMYNKVPGDMSDYDFVLYYLSNLDSYYGDIKKYFLQISREEFDKNLASR